MRFVTVGGSTINLETIAYVSEEYFGLVVHFNSAAMHPSGQAVTPELTLRGAEAAEFRRALANAIKTGAFGDDMASEGGRGA